MVVDGHAHSAGEFCTAEGVVRVLDGLGVDKVLLCPGPINEPRTWPVPDLTWLLEKDGLSYAGGRLLRLAGRLIPERHNLHSGNAYIASLAALSPDRILQVYWIDPRDSRMRAELDGLCREWKFRILKVHQCFHPIRSDSAEMRELARFTGDRGVPFFIHLYSRRDAAELLDLMYGHPGTTFIIAHLLGLEVFERAGRGRLRNVYLDISPPNLVPASFVARAVAAFGADRVLLGSDTPYGKDNLQKAIVRVRGLDIPEADKTLILGENLRRLLDL